MERFGYFVGSLRPQSAPAFCRCVADAPLRSPALDDAGMRAWGPGHSLVAFFFLSLSAMTLASTGFSLRSPQSAPSPLPQNPSPMVDFTRPHPRVPPQEVAGRRFPLSTGTLYLSPHFRARTRIPLVVHFHGAPWLVEYHMARRRPDAALVTVQLGSGSGIYARTFAEPERLRTLLDEARTHLQQVTGREVTWDRVTLSSFSAGYGAVRSILQQAEHYARIDAIILADSLHTGYLPGKKPATLEEPPLRAFVRFAQEAAQGRKRLAMTHSEVYPGTFASTTETADYLLARLALKRQAVLRRGPLGMQQLSRVSAGRFHLAGFAGNSAPDHMDHLYALGDWLRTWR